MKFIPFGNKVVIEPLEKKGIIETGEDRFLECGTVISVGIEVTFVKPGDTIFFDAWGHSLTAEFEGKKYHVVSCTDEVIFGKYAAKK